jgi:hypothetical protein
MPKTKAEYLSWTAAIQQLCEVVPAPEVIDAQKAGALKPHWLPLGQGLQPALAWSDAVKLWPYLQLHKRRFAALFAPGTLQVGTERRDPLEAVLCELYPPDGVPPRDRFTNGQIIKAVGDAYKDKRINPVPSRNTILRRAGRSKT